MGLAVFGWAFVNIVTLRRTDPFTSGNGSHDAFKKLLMMVPIIFLYSTINTQRQPHDLQGYCTPQVAPLVASAEPAVQQKVETDSVDDLFESIAAAMYFSKFEYGV